MTLYFFVRRCMMIAGLNVDEPGNDIATELEVKNIYIFCEGAKREYHYFNYFKWMDSRINLEVYKLHQHENNSTLGWLNIANESIIKSENNPNPKSTFQKNDEIWIVLDTDRDSDKSRIKQIEVQKYSFNC